MNRSRRGRSASRFAARCFAVDGRLIRDEAANRLGDPYRSVRSAPRRPQTLALSPSFADKNPETVMVDFVQPTGSGGRAIERATRVRMRGRSRPAGIRVQRAGEARHGKRARAGLLIRPRLLTKKRQLPNI